MRQLKKDSFMSASAPYLVFGAAFLIMLSALAGYSYFFWFRLGHSLSEDPADWGVFGDFIGGLANPIVSLATLLIVVLAYLHQRRELAATAKALEESNTHQVTNRKIDAYGVQIGQLDAEIRSLTGKLDFIRSTNTRPDREAIKRRSDKIAKTESEIEFRLERRHALAKKISELTGVDADAIDPGNDG